MIFLGDLYMYQIIKTKYLEEDVFISIAAQESDQS